MNMKKIVINCAAFVFCASPYAAVHAESFAIHYGPRSFLTAPVGTNAIDLKYENLDAGLDINGQVLRGFDIETNSGLISYTHYFEFAGKTASVIASLPYVKLEGSLELATQTATLFEESGITDPYFQFYTPLLGGEALDLQSFMRSEPGLTIGVFAAARPPLGEYDESKPANPGANRWEARFGLPVQYVSGLPTQQTSFEFVPVVYLFEDNDEAFGGSVVGQDPLVSLEAHITHDFNQMLWGSLNTLYAFGGESSIDGEEQGDEFDYLGGGFTVGMRLPNAFGANVTWGTSLNTKTDEADGNWIRASLTKSF